MLSITLLNTVEKAKLKREMNPIYLVDLLNVLVCLKHRPRAGDRLFFSFSKLPTPIEQREFPLKKMVVVKSTSGTCAVLAVW